MSKKIVTRRFYETGETDLMTVQEAVDKLESGSYLPGIVRPMLEGGLRVTTNFAEYFIDPQRLTMGMFIRGRREMLGINQNQFGVDPAFISRIESDQQTCSVHTLVTIARVLGLNDDDRETLTRLALAKFHTKLNAGMVA